MTWKTKPITIHEFDHPRYGKKAIFSITEDNGEFDFNGHKFPTIESAREAVESYTELVAKRHGWDKEEG